MCVQEWGQGDGSVVVVERPRGVFVEDNPSPLCPSLEGGGGNYEGTWGKVETGSDGYSEAEEVQ